MEKRNWSKSQETKFSRTHFGQKNWKKNCRRQKSRNKLNSQNFVKKIEHKKFLGKKLLETSICDTNLEKNSGKNRKDMKQNLENIQKENL